MVRVMNIYNTRVCIVVGWGMGYDIIYILLYIYFYYYYYYSFILRQDPPLLTAQPGGCGLYGIKWSGSFSRSDTLLLGKLHRRGAFLHNGPTDARVCLLRKPNTPFHLKFRAVQGLNPAPLARRHRVSSSIPLGHQPPIVCLLYAYCMPIICRY